MMGAAVFLALWGVPAGASGEEPTKVRSVGNPIVGKTSTRDSAATGKKGILDATAKNVGEKMNEAAEKPEAPAEGKGGSDPAPKKKADDSAMYPRFYIHGGLCMVSPYKFVAKEGGGYSLDTTADSRAFVELAYNDRWAYRNDLQPTDDWVYAWPPNSTPSSKWLETFDTKARLGFTFAGDGSEIPTASTIAGGSDVNLDLLISRHVLRRVGKDFRFSAGPEVAGSVVTDFNSLTLHSRIFGGLGWAMGFNWPGSAPEDPWQATFELRGGYSFMDTPRLKAGADGKMEPVLNSLGKPTFDTFEGAGTAEAELSLPLGKKSAITLTTRFYSVDGPDQWAIFVGYTRSLDKLFEGFFPSKGE